MADYLVEARNKNAWQQPVADKDLITSPAASKGDRYIIAGTGGQWSAFAINDIVYCSITGGSGDAVWQKITPAEGWRVYVVDEDKDYRFDGSNWVVYKTAIVGITIDGGGQAVETGLKGYIRIPYAATIVKWTLLADQSGSIKIDVWKDSYANFPPTDADSITNGHEPEISSATKAEDSDLGDWSSVSISSGDVLAFNVDSCTTIERAILELEVTKT